MSTTAIPDLLLGATIKSSLILLCALCAAACLRRRSAALRHWVILAAMAAAALMPLLQPIAPSWRLGMGAPPVEPARRAEIRKELVLARPAGSFRLSVASSSVVGAPDASAHRLALPALPGWLIASVWMAGAVVSLAMLLLGLGRLLWLAARADPIHDGNWAALAQHLAREYRIRRPVRLLLTAHPTLLVTWGLMRPAVMLPRTAQAWPDDRVRIVLAHELAHVRRRDWAVLVGAQLLRSIYWFNPLIWIACRRLRQESEQACDDAVLAAGIEGPVYATHLVDLARTFRAEGRRWLPAPGLARHSSLERRVRAMLNGRLNRNPLTRSAFAVTFVALAGVTIPLAGLGTDAETGSAHVSGAVVDGAGAAVPDARVALTDVATAGSRMARADQAGRYELNGLPAADYLVEATAPGFEAARGRLRLAADDSVQRTITLQIQPLVFSILIGGPASGAVGPGRRTPLPATWTCLSGALSAPGAVVLIGGRGFCGPPSLIEEFERDRREQQTALGRQHAWPASGRVTRPPEYPPHLLAAMIEGSVVVEGRIRTDGSADRLQVVAPVHPDFARAVTDVLSQWQFEPARLSGVAVESPLRATFQFRLHR